MGRRGGGKKERGSAAGTSTLRDAKARDACARQDPHVSGARDHCQRSAHTVPHNASATVTQLTQAIHQAFLQLLLVRQLCRVHSTHIHKAASSTMLTGGGGGWGGAGRAPVLTGAVQAAKACVGHGVRVPIGVPPDRTAPGENMGAGWGGGGAQRAASKRALNHAQDPKQGHGQVLTESQSSCWGSTPTEQSQTPKTACEPGGGVWVGVGVERCDRRTAAAD
jgi:hypothetical protein